VINYVSTCGQLSSDDAQTVHWRAEPTAKHVRSKTVSEGVKVDVEHWNEGIFRYCQFHFHFWFFFPTAIAVFISAIHTGQFNTL